MSTSGNAFQDLGPILKFPCTLCDLEHKAFSESSFPSENDSPALPRGRVASGSVSAPVMGTPVPRLEQQTGCLPVTCQLILGLSSRQVFSCHGGLHTAAHGGDVCVVGVDCLVCV